MKIKNVYYPFLFILFTVLSLYSSNYSEKIKFIEEILIIYKMILKNLGKKGQRDLRLNNFKKY